MDIAFSLKRGGGHIVFFTGSFNEEGVLSICHVLYKGYIASDQWELTASWFPGHTHVLFINTTVSLY